MMPPVSAETCVALGAPEPCLETYPTRPLSLGSLHVDRALPVKNRRLIGPWCFLDRFGPLSFSEGRSMDVAPHPHIGLQTVTWLLEGEVRHDDSLGCEAIARPGNVYVMTSGDGIVHAERTPAANNGRLNGVQLWVALPEQHRRVAPGFQQVDRVPQAELPGGLVQVFAGAVAGAASPARHYSPIVGAELTIHPGSSLELPLEETYEHGILMLDGECMLDTQPLAARHLHYLGTMRAAVTLSSRAGARLLLIGGPPFPETILMWWNFVARTPEEIVAARSDWAARRRFGEVAAYHGHRLEAPNLGRLSPPNAAS